MAESLALPSPCTSSTIHIFATDSFSLPQTLADLRRLTANKTIPPGLFEVLFLFDKKLHYNDRNVS